MFVFFISRLALLDFSAALDTKDHAILLARLKNYIRICGQVLRYVLIACYFVYKKNSLI